MERCLVQYLHGHYEMDWNCSRHTYGQFYVAATGKSDQRKKSGRPFGTDDCGIAAGTYPLGCVWLYAGRCTAYLYQYFFCSRKPCSYLFSDQVQPEKDYLGWKKFKV